MTENWTDAERLAAEVLASGSEDALRDLLTELDKGPPSWSPRPKRSLRSRLRGFRPGRLLDGAVDGGAILAALVAIGIGSRPLVAPIAEARPAIGEAIGQIDLSGAFRTEEGPASVTVTAAERPVTAREPISLLARDLEATVGRYEAVATMYAQRKLPCDQLRRTYLEVEDGWTRYSIARGRAYGGTVPEQLAAWDAALYEAVRGVDRDFNVSGCNRP